jgi:hypothetical protein
MRRWKILVRLFLAFPSSFADSWNSSGSTDGDFCDGGTCMPGTVDPCAQGDACNRVCSEVRETCFAPAGTPCDDGLFCNGIDSCNAIGACKTHTGDPCDLNSGACNSTCDELANTCFAPQGAPCPDSEFCNGEEVCDGQGSCVNTTIPCPVSGCAACDETRDECAAPNSTSCDDDGNPCTLDLCDGRGLCAHTPLVGASCDDNLNCTISDQCDANGVCTGQAVACACTDHADCDDGNNCTTDSCVLNSCAYSALPENTPCDDGNWCNGDDKVSCEPSFDSGPRLLCPNHCVRYFDR